MTIFLLITVYVLLNIVDLFQTKTLLCSYGSEAEANFIVRCIYDWFGFVGVSAYKLVITVAVVLCMINSIWIMGSLVAFYVYVVLHNRSALLDGEKSGGVEFD